MERYLLSEFAGYALRRAQTVVFADFSQALSELNLRPVHFAVLVLIDRNPGTSQSKISAALGIQKANFVAIIADLADRGWVRRQRSKVDARTYSLGLTAAGKSILSRATRLQYAHEARIVAQIGKIGRARLLNLLARLVRLSGAPPS